MSLRNAQNLFWEQCNNNKEIESCCKIGGKVACSYFFQEKLVMFFKQWNLGLPLLINTEIYWDVDVNVE